MPVKRILSYLLGLCFLAAVGYALRYVATRRGEIQCRALRVSMASSAQTSLVTARAVENLITQEVGDLVGKPLYAINAHAIETMVDNLPVVKKAQAYPLASGLLCVSIQQRIPILRIIARDGSSYYVTWEGTLYPAALDYAAHTLVANGYIEPPLDSLALQDPLQGAQSHLFTQLLELARYVYKHSFWRAQLTQLYVTSNQNVELVPRVGGQIVQLGSLDDYQYKLKKLRALYAASLPANGLNAYSEIDLRYGDQVICRTPSQK